MTNGRLRLISGMRPPQLRDPRYSQLAALLLYAIVAREVFHIERTHLVALITVLWAAALDLFLGFLFYDRLKFPLSSVIVGLAAGLLIDARSVFFYMLVVTVAILSKAFITSKRRHFFNPVNFGIIVCIQFLPNQIAANTQVFSGYLWPSVVFAVVGVSVALYSRQLAVAGGWIAGFVGMALLRSAFPGSSGLMAFGPLLSTSVLFFTFHMITDPATTPRTTSMKIAYGVFAALVDGVLRIAQTPHSQLYALFIANAILIILRAEEDRGAPPVEIGPVSPTPANTAL